jgi:hypothetical protein
VFRARVLESGAKRVMLNCTRQCGKSTVTAVKAVEQAYTEAESLTLVVSGDRPVCPQGTHRSFGAHVAIELPRGSRYRTG